MSLTIEHEQEKSFFQKHKQKLVALSIWVLVIAGYFYYTRSQGLTVPDTVKAISNVLTGPIGPLLYIIIYILRPLLFFPSTLLTVVGGALFGPLGILWTVIGANCSAMAAYFVGRYFGQGFLENDDSSTGLIQKYAKRMRENSFMTVLTMRFIYMPYDLVHYLSGMLKIDWKSFLLATIIGSLPGTVVFVLIGASFGDVENAINGELPSLNPWLLALSAAIFVVSLVLSRYFKQREAKSQG